jgi:NAD(P)H-nitrite reductase large subunit
MHVAILGNGVTGVTAAMRLREKRPDWRITIVSGESKYHYSRPALMYVFMGHMRFADTKPFEDHVWAHKRLELVQGWVSRIDHAAKRLEFADGRTPLAYDRLLVATGAKSNKFGWPGQDLRGVQGLWGLHDLKTLHESCAGAVHAVIVGGGLIGIELAEMLHSRGIHITFLVREKSYWNNILNDEESSIINDAIREAGMDLRLESELEEIVDDGSGRCCAVVTKGGDRLDCQIVGLTPGVSPNADLARASGLPCGRGVLVDRSLRTEIEGVYAAGDCAEIVTGEERNVIEQVWYTGKAQGEVAADVLAGEAREYRSGTWFNSAKFLDIEYQVYGRVNRRVEGEVNLYWEAPDRRHSFRLVHLAGRVIGIQVMGTRLRHRVCERWIDDGVTVEHVLAHLEEAHFDPELFRTHEDAIRAALRAEVAA